MKRRSAKLLALLLGLSLIAAACGDDDDSGSENTDGTTEEEPSDEPRSGGELIDGGTFSSAPPPHIDPALVSELDGAQVSIALYDGLTDYDNTDPDNPVLVGNVAEDDWTVNDEATEFVFTIRDGVEFSDGTPVLPSSFARGWNRAVQPTLAADYAYIATPIEGFQEVQDGAATEMSGVVADDEAMTLTVTLTDPYADWASVVSHPFFSPMPEAVDELTDQTQWEQGIMIGNGPFKMAQPQTDQEIVLDRNDTYFGGLSGRVAYLDRVTFKVSADLNSAYSSLEAGEYDSATIPDGRFDEATGKYGNTAEPFLATYHFDFDMTDPVVGGEDGLLLRQAISQAINRDQINDAVYDGSRTISTGVTPPGIPGFQEGLCEYCSYDVAAAQAAFDEWEAAGNAQTEPLKIQVNDDAGHTGVVAIIVDNLAQIGIEAEAEILPSDTYFAQLREGACQLCRAGWFFDYPIYDNGLFDLFHSASIGGNNLGPTDDEEVDSLIDEGRRTTDDEARFEIFGRAEARLLNEIVSVVPINWYNGDYVYADDVKGFEQTPLGYVFYDNVWIDE
jgi:ABC-type transport system substrate-binding protein